MLVDANILLYAVDETSPFHDSARAWLEGALNGDERIGIPWQSPWAFLRIATNPRALADPMTSVDAWTFAQAWLDAPVVWVPAPGFRHREIFERLVVERDLRANLISDAVLVALGLEHGLSIVSADSDFARFPQVRWINPVA
jgi:hypothetical protein